MPSTPKTHTEVRYRWVPSDETRDVYGGPVPTSITVRRTEITYPKDRRGVRWMEGQDVVTEWDVPIAQVPGLINELVRALHFYADGSAAHDDQQALLAREDFRDAHDDQLDHRTG